MPNRKFFRQEIGRYLAGPMLLTWSLLIAGNGLVAASDGILPEASVERAGLTVDWFTQLDVGPRSKIVNMQLQVNEDKTTRYYLVEYGGRVERISQYDLDAFGKPRGIEGAEAHANVRKEIIEAELAAQGRGEVEVTVRAISLPQATIFAVDRQGKATAIDADSGQQLWSTHVGDRRNPSFGIGTSKNHVAVVMGTKVYCLSAENGKVMWSQQCENAPAAAPAVSENQIYVPLMTGRLQVLDIDNEGLIPKSYISYGTSVAKPLVTDRTVSWATSDGYYSVAPVDPEEGRAVKYHLHSGGSFVSAAAYNDGIFYVSTVEGSVFAIDELRGSLVWEYPTGDRIVSPPFIVGNSVFVITADNSMYKIDTKTGRLADGWDKPIAGVSQFVGVSSEKIYGLNSLGQLIAIDPASGEILSRIASHPLTMVLPNPQSDRLYVGNERGQLQCLREKANTYPSYYTGETELASTEAAKQTKDESQQPAAGDDPFADETDPFASDSSDAAMDPKDDPFAGGDDGDDPFAADDPDSKTEPRDDSDDDAGDPFAADDSGGGNSGGEDDNDDPFAGGGSP